AGGLEVEADEPRGRPGSGVSRSGTVDSRISRGPRIRSRRLCGWGDGRGGVDVDERGGEIVDGAAEVLTLSGSGESGPVEGTGHRFEVDAVVDVGQAPHDLERLVQSGLDVDDGGRALRTQASGLHSGLGRLDDRVERAEIAQQGRRG